ncbi:hypothetical protein [Kingella potus]|uniref:hypothetical protein n=1 Tax=Kingella potus TaxID=265175 RepID=UPI0011C06B9D|nr:hypothetical protein [Kingella potus]
MKQQQTQTRRSTFPSSFSVIEEISATASGRRTGGAVIRKIRTTAAAAAHSGFFPSNSAASGKKTPYKCQTVRKKHYVCAAGARP